MHFFCHQPVDRLQKPKNGPLQPLADREGWASARLFKESWSIHKLLSFRPRPDERLHGIDEAHQPLVPRLCLVTRKTLGNLYVPNQDTLVIVTKRATSRYLLIVSFLALSPAHGPFKRPTIKSVIWECRTLLLPTTLGDFPTRCTRHGQCSFLGWKRLQKLLLALSAVVFSPPWFLVYNKERSSPLSAFHRPVVPPSVFCALEDSPAGMRFPPQPWIAAPPTGQANLPHACCSDINPIRHHVS